MAGYGDEFCDDPFDDYAYDDDDDDGESEGEGDPCDDEASCDDGAEDEDEDKASCDDGAEDEDEDEASCDHGDEDEDEDEELSDVEEDGEGEELRDDEGDCEGQSEDLRDEPSGDDDESEGEELCGVPCDGDAGGGRGGEGSCVSCSSIRDGSESYLSDSLEDRPSSEEEEEDEEDEAPGLDRGGERRVLPIGLGRWPPPVTGAFRMVVGFDDTDSDDYSDDDSTYSDVGDVEFPSLPASRAAVAGLTEETLNEEEASWGCPVCKDVFASGQRVVWLPCKHYFHGDCIRPWLAIRSTCPVCRYQLPTDNAESGQRQARELTVLVPVAQQGAPPQSGDRGRGEGNSGRTTIGAGDATGCSTDGGPEQGAS